MTKTEKDFNFHVTRKINIQKQAEPLLEPPKKQQVDTRGVEYKYKHFPKDKSPILKAEMQRINLMSGFSEFWLWGIERQGLERAYRVGSYNLF